MFLIWPLITGIYYSFTSYDVLTPPRWTGLDNYRALIADDRFWNSLKVTVEYVAINIGVQTILAVLIAALMHRLTKSTVVRSLILSPYLVSNVVTALTFLWMLDIQFGIVNQLIVKLGGGRPSVSGVIQSGSSRRSRWSMSGETWVTQHC